MAVSFFTATITPDGQGDNDAQNQRQRSQLQGGREATHHQLPGSLVLPLEGIAEIALKDVADVLEVLEGQRLVESPRFFHPVEVLLGRLDGQQNIQGVAGDPGQSEDNYADGDQRDQGVKDSYYDKTLHNRTSCRNIVKIINLENVYRFHRGCRFVAAL